MGTFAVQIAKSLGAEVTAVCSTANLGTSRSIGADHVIDYTQEDFTRNGRRYDVIIAANGYHPMLDYRRSLGPAGICVVLGGAWSQLFGALLVGPVLSRLGNRKIRLMVAKSTHADLLILKAMLETRTIVPVIDRCYSLADAGEAIAYLIKGHARGKVVFTVSNEASRSAQPGS